MHVLDRICRGKDFIVNIFVAVAPHFRLCFAGQDEIKLYMRVFLSKLDDRECGYRVKAEGAARVKMSCAVFDKQRKYPFKYLREIGRNIRVYASVSRESDARYLG